MKLLKNVRQWRKFLREDVGMYSDQVKQRDSYAAQPPAFPCYGYAVVVSFNYEELKPLYLSIVDIDEMRKQLLKDFR